MASRFILTAGVKEDSQYQLPALTCMPAYLEQWKSNCFAIVACNYHNNNNNNSNSNNYYYYYYRYFS